MEMMRQELKELRESQREEERRISDESRLLYAEAFGSFNLGLGGAKSDSEVCVLILCLLTLANHNNFIILYLCNS